MAEESMEGDETAGETEVEVEVVVEELKPVV